MKKLILIAAPLCLATIASAQVVLTGNIYTQDFDSLPNTGTPTWTDNSTLAGWYAKRTGSTNLLVGNGSANTGALYSAGSTGSTDRALGTIQSGGTGVWNFGVVLQNNSGVDWSGFTVQMQGETWRRGTTQTAVDRLDFSSKVRSDLTGFSIDEAGFTSDPIHFIPTALTPLSGAAGAYDGNVSGNRLAVQFTSNQTVTSGQYIVLRWTDFNVASSDDLIAIDDLSFSAEAVPEPATMTILAGAAAIAALRRRKK